MNRTVALMDETFREAGPLELTVDVAGEDEAPKRHLFGPAPQNGKTIMGNRPPVEVEPVAVEAPRERRVGLERARGCHFREVQALLAQSRIGLPESGIPAEVRQP